jgi:hypothetical protein
MAYDYKSTQVTTIDSDDNTYLSEADLRGRVRVVAFDYTATGTVATTSTIELARIKATRIIGQPVIAPNGATSAATTLELGLGTPDGAVTDADALGDVTALNVAGVQTTSLNDGTSDVAYLDLGADEVAIVATVGGAALAAADSFSGFVTVVQ